MDDSYEVTTKMSHTDLLRDAAEDVDYAGAELTVKKAHTDLLRNVEEHEAEAKAATEASLEDLAAQLKQL